LKSRLEADPELRRLAKPIARLGIRSLRSLTDEVCSLGVVKAGLGANREVSRALRALSGKTGLSSREESALRQLAEAADEAYLDELDKRGCVDKGVASLFRKARVLAGLVAAFDANPRRAATEAAYEIGVGLGPSEDFIELIERVLARSTAKAPKGVKSKT